MIENYVATVCEVGVLHSDVLRGQRFGLPPKAEVVRDQT